MLANSLHTFCRLGGPQSGDKSKSGDITRDVLGTHMWAKIS